MPRCVDKIERGPLQYASLWKVAQGMTVAAGEIRHDYAGADRDLGRQRLLRDQEALIRDISAAMREELLELAGAGCAIIQMEEPNIHLVGDPARRRHASWASTSSSRSSTTPSRDCAT